MYKEQQVRYLRNTTIPEVGIAGQERLLSSKVLVIGAGGLGSPLLFYLAAAGVGTLGVVDDDSVDLSNLQRQILHSTNDLGRVKVETAKETLTALNPSIHIVPYPCRLTKNNVDTLITDYELVVVACDNFETRLIVNAACLQQEKTMLTAAVFCFFGQLYTFKPYMNTACYQCVYPQTPAPDTQPFGPDPGVMGSVVGQLGSWLATETIKELLDVGESLAGQMMVVDALNNAIRKIKIPRDPTCACCGTH